MQARCQVHICLSFMLAKRLMTIANSSHLTPPVCKALGKRIHRFFVAFSICVIEHNPKRTSLPLEPMKVFGSDKVMTIYDNYNQVCVKKRKQMNLLDEIPIERKRPFHPASGPLHALEPRVQLALHALDHGLRRCPGVHVHLGVNIDRTALGRKGEWEWKPASRVRAAQV